MDQRMPTPLAILLIIILALTALVVSGRAAQTLTIIDDGPNILVFENPLESGDSQSFDILGGQTGENYSISILIRFDEISAWTPENYWRTQFDRPGSPGPIKAKIVNKDGNIDDWVILAAAIETPDWMAEGPRLVERTNDPDLANREGQAYLSGGLNTVGSGNFGWLDHQPTVIPEPKPVVFILMGLGHLLIMRRRR